MIEVQVVERVFEPAVAQRFGLHEGQVTVMIHTGSRGLGYQVCSDHVREMVKALPVYRIALPDPQLAAAPVDSRHGRRYLSAMAAAANFGRANRQVISWGVRQAFGAVIGEAPITLVYDISHNLAKLETHDVDGHPKQLCVHRKGATRALPAGHPDLPAVYRDVGEPVLVPGSMGTASYVLVGRSWERGVLFNLPRSRPGHEPACRDADGQRYGTAEPPSPCGDRGRDPFYSIAA